MEGRAGARSRPQGPRTAHRSGSWSQWQWQGAARPLPATHLSHVVEVPVRHGLGLHQLAVAVQLLVQLEARLQQLQAPVGEALHKGRVHDAAQLKVVAVVLGEGGDGKEVGGGNGHPALLVLALLEEGALHELAARHRGSCRGVAVRRRRVAVAWVHVLLGRGEGALDRGAGGHEGHACSGGPGRRVHHDHLHDAVLEAVVQVRQRVGAGGGEGLEGRLQAPAVEEVAVVLARLQRHEGASLQHGGGQGARSLGGGHHAGEGRGQKLASRCGTRARLGSSARGGVVRVRVGAVGALLAGQG